MTCDGFLGWLSQVVVVVVGWVVVHYLGVKRDRDRARRELVINSVDALSDAVNQLLVDARSYHVGARDIELELKLKMSLQDLAMRVAGLSDVWKDETTLAHCRRSVSDLRRAITSTHFEDEHIASIGDTDPQMQTIAEAVFQAKRLLMTVKHRQFRVG